ncbi:gamma-glutamyl-gamma-aminobutyrate hydrolase family protein [Pseudochrobactrum kiredjianiae]|uniref:Gamma-glutamyl-gamma-aminobutyrate hydrolase family protein n=1 Tax=Pseudochrobactrum kiredjianiae TaxID=386305 RepID=A0ABW3UZA5_9HYPH|nr:gamma-glutamyl-gamma-aminobutyrate hydrolase family protein [Pseudochrobactrum kiredjianiae]MDM7852859.1 gamma-glutamyl-gamma-aminobutyrate hydrolase family protein [Pseudochrobactrum kiredjianiae]
MTQHKLFRPIIGVTLDSEEGGGFSDSPWYAIRQNYLSCLEEAGAVPIALPHLAELAENYLNMIDGLVVTGGAFDVPPAMFGEEARTDTIRLKPARTKFEAAVLRGALERDMPVLGICGGHQLLAVIAGGTLVQHIPDEVLGAMEHSVSKDTENADGKERAGHSIAIEQDSLLAKLVGTTAQHVNSSHHQSVRTVKAPMRVTATAEDGVIEAIEHTGKSFAIGVQWHPEYKQMEGDVHLLTAFCAAAEAYHNR